MKKLTDSADIGKHRIVKRKYWMQLTAMMLSFMMIACSMPECSAFSEKTFASEIQDAEFQDTEPLDSDVFEELPESMAADAVENQDDQMELPASPESQEGQMEVPADTDAEIRNGEIEAPAGADGDEAAEASFYDEQSSWTGQDESELAGEQPADSTYSGESASQNAEIPAEVDSTNEFLPEEAPAEGDLSEELPADNLPAEGFTDETPQEYTSPSDQIFEAVPEETPVPDPEIEADVEGSANPETSVEPDPFLSEDAAIEESAEVKKDATVRSGYCGDNVTWNLDDSGNLLISGEGSMYDYASKASPFYMMSEVTSIKIEEGVTDIGDYVFNGCSELRKVQLPLSIVRIGTGAFMDCTCLTDIYYAGSKRNWNTIVGSDDCLPSGASFYPAIESEEISIQECTVSGIQTKTYTGQPIIQDITIKDGDTQLTEDLDYNVEYKDNIKAGTATVIITGTGTYTGTVEKTYAIKPKNITPAVSLSKTAFVYNGKVQKPVVAVKDGTTEIAASDYTLTYSSGLKNTGTYKIIVDLKGNYTGNKTVSYKITARKITPAVSLSKTTFVYNGKVQKPVVTVKDGTTKLTASDYTLTYSSGLKNAGTYKIIVRLKRNYTGTKTVSYKITARKITPTVSLSKSAFVYNGKAQKPAVTVKAGNTKLTTADYTLSFSSGRINAGNYKIIVRLKKNYSGTKTVSYKINPKKVTPTVTLSKTRFTYNGKIQKPVVAVKIGKAKIAPTKYAVLYGKNLMNVGRHKITVKLKGNYTGSRTVMYAVDPRGTSITSAVGENKKVTVKWKKQIEQITGYQVQYSQNSHFTSGNKTISFANSGKTSATISRPYSWTNYYVRIRTYKKIGNTSFYSSWSKGTYTAVKQTIKKASSKTLTDHEEASYSFTTTNRMMFTVPIKISTEGKVYKGGIYITLKNSQGRILQNDYIDLKNFSFLDNFGGWYYDDALFVPPGTYTYTIKNTSATDIKVDYSILSFLKRSTSANVSEKVSVKSGNWVKIGKMGEGCPLIDIDISNKNVITEWSSEIDGSIWVYADKKGSSDVFVKLDSNGKKYKCNVKVSSGNPDFYACTTGYYTRDNYFEVKVKNLRSSNLIIVRDGAQIVNYDYKEYDRKIKSGANVVIKPGETKYVRFYINGDYTWTDYEDFDLHAKIIFEDVSYIWHVWRNDSSFKMNGKWWDTYWDEIEYSDWLQN